MGRQRADVLAAEGDAAGARRQPGDGAQQCRLAGAVRAENRHQFAFGDAKGGGLQRLDVAVMRRQLIDVQQERGGGHPLSLDRNELGVVDARHHIGVLDDADMLLGSEGKCGEGALIGRQVFDGLAHGGPLDGLRGLDGFGD